ncbi:hypothetical protein B1H10_04590 [candidate division KSB1 bacterium 4484_188]|nr:MAG: hypothetical protein B1H10_04590 [candidate division KSB1 bacterium 4484_188]
MKKIVKQLIELQEIDTRFDELQMQKGDLPLMIEEAENDLEEIKSQENELEIQLKKGEADRRMFQVEIEAGRGKLKEYEDKLYKVQTNKEYDAISLEIDTKKMEINELENKILQSLEEEEETKKNLDELKERLEKVDKQLDEYRHELEEIIKHTRAEEARLSKEREKITEVIDKRILRQYQRIRKAKGGLAVVPIKKGSCGGCFSAIPPQRIVEIRELNRMHTCENCGRILVWIDDFVE